MWFIAFISTTGCGLRNLCDSNDGCWNLPWIYQFEICPIFGSHVIDGSTLMARGPFCSHRTSANLALRIIVICLARMSRNYGSWKYLSAYWTSTNESEPLLDGCFDAFHVSSSLPLNGNHALSTLIWQQVCTCQCHSSGLEHGYRIRPGCCWRAFGWGDNQVCSYLVNTPAQPNHRYFQTQRATVAWRIGKVN